MDKYQKVYKTTENHVLPPMKIFPSLQNYEKCNSSLQNQTEASHTIFRIFFAIFRTKKLYLIVQNHTVSITTYETSIRVCTMTLICATSTLINTDNKAENRGNFHTLSVFNTLCDTRISDPVISV